MNLRPQMVSQEHVLLTIKICFTPGHTDKYFHPGRDQFRKRSLHVTSRLFRWQRAERKGDEGTRWAGPRGEKGGRPTRLLLVATSRETRSLYLPTRNTATLKPVFPFKRHVGINDRKTSLAGADRARI